MNVNMAAVFIDRDGTLIEEVNYLSQLVQIRPFPGVAQALGRLNRAGFPVVVVSNQSGVARGYITEAFVAESMAALARMVEADGGRFDGWFACPHHPKGQPPYDQPCDCRKPAPGMLIKARDQLGVRLEGSYMIGDKATDMETGRELGLIPLLVRTGYGAQEEPDLDDGFAARGGRVFDNLVEALDYVMEKEGAA